MLGYVTKKSTWLSFAPQLHRHRHLQLQLQLQRQVPALCLLHRAAAGGEGHHRGFLRPRRCRSRVAPRKGWENAGKTRDLSSENVDRSTKTVGILGQKVPKHHPQLRHIELVSYITCEISDMICPHAISYSLKVSISLLWHRYHSCLV